MKRLDFVWSCAVCLASAGAVRAESAAPPKVTICIENVLDVWLANSASGLASKVYAGIGVETQWRYSAHSCPADAIRVSFRDETPEDLHPGSLAFAKPIEGIHVEVFFDRVCSTVERRLAPYLLAYVLVHETAHILQGVVRHSETGIMKAKWNHNEYAQMALGTLHFTDEDVRLIHLGMERRIVRLHAGQAGSLSATLEAKAR